MYYYEHSPTFFGAYCTIYRENLSYAQNYCYYVL